MRPGVPIGHGDNGAVTLAAVRRASANAPLARAPAASGSGAAVRRWVAVQRTHGNWAWLVNSGPYGAGALCPDRASPLSRTTAGATRRRARAARRRGVVVATRTAASTAAAQLLTQLQPAKNN